MYALDDFKTVTTNFILIPAHLTRLAGHPPVCQLQPVASRDGIGSTLQSYWFSRFQRLKSERTTVLSHNPCCLLSPLRRGEYIDVVVVVGGGGGGVVVVEVVIVGGGVVVVIVVGVGVVVVVVVVVSSSSSSSSSSSNGSGYGTEIVCVFEGERGKEADRRENNFFLTERLADKDSDTDKVYRYS
ncbi:LOW QUALITY PROTEIN: hypothetical protein ElyMa_004114700 [Elysia marginata]|uniref:Uncharacterized protein n=1 Tax=Elysia marginata TaxID=1093978 RepID=A0AAV4GD50_9GAST|nr:LOW QUALITY PROTEIN: hypothetical protein ElyMa_004114700 [Elysia marginata]